MTTEHHDGAKRSNVPIVATGVSIVAGKERLGEGVPFQAIDPRTSEYIGPSFRSASANDIIEAVASAVRVHSQTFMKPGLTNRLLYATAQLLEDASEAVITTCLGETGLSESRIRSELERTSNQLRFLAEVAGSGERLDATIDHGDRNRAISELRKVRLPIGPVAVFGASNFPLAFSVLGGDTASALAAGCPVIMKAHPAHPSTSELCARLMSNALNQCGLDSGWFSLLHGNGSSVGAQLVQTEGIRAIAFTGSMRGGRSLFDLAASRSNPIPVFAEMGSMNPVFVTSAAIRARGNRIAEELARSITGSAGQLCTKPGLIFVPEGRKYDVFERDLSRAFENISAEYLLTPPIHDALATQFQLTSAITGVDTLASQPSRPNESGLLIPGNLFRTNLSVFKQQPDLQTEHFGASAILVSCPESEFTSAPDLLEGSLTGTIFLDPDEGGDIAELLVALVQRVGRIIVNGVPTGVRVARAMTHGGPYPSTTSARDTSVGAAALDRFLRPVTFQDVPDIFLPPALRANNPLGIVRSVDGKLTNEANRH